MKPTIEEALDQCIEQMRGGAPINAVLAAYPDYADELRPLLLAGSALAAFPEPAVTVRGLMHALSREAVTPRPHRGTKRLARFFVFPAPVWLRAAAGVVVLFTVGWGVSSISAQAAPGDWTYPVKRAIERVRLLLTLNANNEAELRITFSERRLAEAVRRFERGEGLDDGLLRAALEDSKLALEEALNVSPQERAYLVSQASYLTAHQKNVITAIQQTAPPKDQTVANSFGDMCDQRMNWMDGMMEDMRMTPPTEAGWRPRREPAAKADTSAETKTPNKPPPSQQQVRRWMDDCPDWRE